MLLLSYNFPYSISQVFQPRKWIPQDNIWLLPKSVKVTQSTVGVGHNKHQVCPWQYNCKPVEIFIKKLFLEKDIFEEVIYESSWWTESFQIKIFFKSLANWFLACPWRYNCNPVEIFLEKSFLDKDIFEEVIDESSWWTESFQIKIFFKSLANWFLACPWRYNCNPVEIFLEKSFLDKDIFEEVIDEPKVFKYKYSSHL